MNAIKILNKKHHQFEYCCGNFEFSSSINKGATIRLTGGGGAGFKKQSGSGFGKTKILALTMCEKNIWTPSIEKKCLPSIHEKQMSSSIHETKMSAL